MPSLPIGGLDPSPKRQKLSHSGTPATHTPYTRSSVSIKENQPSTPPNDGLESSFRHFTALSKVASSPTDFILDISKYIPVGCLRVRRSESVIASDSWSSCNEWAAFAHPRDVYNPQAGPFLPSAFQELLLASSTLQPFHGLLNYGWIRMEFKARNQHWGQARVYILPDDVGRRSVQRANAILRKSMLALIGRLDISDAVWRDRWVEDTPFVHLDASLDREEGDQPSLFHLFNTLPSPTPDPHQVAEIYAREAMYRILDSDIEGLTTKMYSYQRRSAAMMLQREVQPARLLDPRLREMRDQLGCVWYCDVDSGSFYREPRTYEAAQGGICAETMGLGKTLICLALILATRDSSSKIPVEYSVGTIPIRKETGSLMDMAAATLRRSGVPWKGDLAQYEAEGYDFAQCRAALKRNPGFYLMPNPVPQRMSRRPKVQSNRKIWLSTATIVVAPTNLVQQWLHEIKKHTVGLKVLVMNSLTLKLPPTGELLDYDIILFSKQRFEKEAKGGANTSSRTASPHGRSSRSVSLYSPHSDIYESRLQEIHFKRIITDEGHAFGNSSGSAKTEAAIVIESLQLSARWIVSGTPTQGLYGLENATTEHHNRFDSSLDSDSSGSSTSQELTQSLATMNKPQEQEELFYKQERKDLEKLGNIATIYLKAKPWANEFNNDKASWSQLVMQPRHGSGSHGNMECLRATLEGMIVRHRPEDVAHDVVLPPLRHDIVYLDGSIQNKLSLNLFSMMIITNAITSERKDADYFFHPQQRKNLMQLVSNLRQSSFFWSNFETEHIRSTVKNAREFLQKGAVSVTPEDEALLRQAIDIGEEVISNGISRAVSKWHEMPIYIQIDCPEAVRQVWSLDGASTNPMLMGATMVVKAQKFVISESWKDDMMEGLIKEGRRAMRVSLEALNPDPSATSSRRQSTRSANGSRTGADKIPALAGGVIVGDQKSPKKRTRAPSLNGETVFSIASLRDPQLMFSMPTKTTSTMSDGKPKSALKPAKTDISGALDPASPLASATMISTASTKLSYLMDRILAHQENEKILVFYEADNVAYYIAQALECLGIQHLIYAKSLSSVRRSQYVVTFNQSTVFRVLLMDVSQAAFGLDMSSASRVYFVNPVFSPQVEAQAVKRAHRIGQVRPVYVETLVLRGSIEEAIMARRKDMSNEEHHKCKNILDDVEMYNWIRNVRFLSTNTDGVPYPDQMAKLTSPQPMFSSNNIHPDADLILEKSGYENEHEETNTESGGLAREGLEEDYTQRTVMGSTSRVARIAMASFSDDLLPFVASRHVPGALPISRLADYPSRALPNNSRLPPRGETRHAGNNMTTGSLLMRSSIFSSSAPAALRFADPDTAASSGPAASSSPGAEDTEMNEESEKGKEL